MPFVRGFLSKFHPGTHPDQGLPPGIEGPVDPDYGIEGPDGGLGIWQGRWPDYPSQRPLPPTLPPKDEWPPLPPFFAPGVGLPIPPSPEHPWVPIPPGPEVDPPEIWPPMPSIPDLPDMSGKTLILARFYVSRHVNYLRWVVIDHEEAKSKLQKVLEWLKAHAPTLPPRPQPR